MPCGTAWTRAKPSCRHCGRSKWRTPSSWASGESVRPRHKPRPGSAFLSVLPIVVDGETTTRAWGDTLGLARAHNLSAYDAAYLELAMRRGLPLATLDDKLKSVALAVGVPLFAVPI